MAVLNEKELEFDIEYIDLQAKPDWFLKISPTGKVPVLQTPDEHVLFESAIINEYLDESHEPHFMPNTPLQRAHHRMWSDFVAGLYGSVYRAYNAEDEESAQAALDAIRGRLLKLEGEIVGPLFYGQEFTLVDATAAPPFTRISWIEHIVPDLDLFTDTPKVKIWKEALLSRPSVRNSILPNLYEIFRDRLQGGNSWLSNHLTNAVLSS